MTTPRHRFVIASARQWDASALQLALIARALVERDMPVLVAIPAEAEVYWREMLPDVLISSFDASAGARTIRAVIRKSMEEGQARVAVVDDDVLRRICARVLPETGCVLRRIELSGRIPDVSLASRLWERRVLHGMLVPDASEPAAQSAARERDAHFPIPVAALIVEDEVRRATRETPVVIVIPDPEAPLESLPALRAAAQVARRHEDLRVHILGAANRVQSLRVHASALGLAAQVTTGPLPVGQLELPAGTVAAWVSAVGDTGAMAMLSAMSQRVPILVSRTSGIAGAVADRITGVHLDTHEPLADAVAAGMIARLIGHEDEQRSMGTAARARVHRLHGIARLGDAVLAAAGQLLSARRRAA